MQERRLKSSLDAEDDGPRFTILQYNILSDCALPPEELSDAAGFLCGSYSYCPAEHRYMTSKQRC